MLVLRLLGGCISAENPQSFQQTARRAAPARLKRGEVLNLGIVRDGRVFSAEGGNPGESTGSGHRSGTLRPRAAEAWRFIRGR